MEAILSKEGGGYDLYRIDEDGKRVTFASTQDYKQKLSLKNCQAIERGYDLDELALEAFELDLNCQGDCNNYYERLAYKLGMIKMIGLLGDKKFNEEDMQRAMNWIMTQYFEFHEQPTMGRREHYIQSIQQTEWDCIVEMEGFVDEEGIYCGERPKLDADGCLILKRK